MFLTPFTAEDCMPATHLRRIKSVEVLLPEAGSEEDLVDFSVVFDEDQLPLRRRHSFSKWVSGGSSDAEGKFRARASTPVPIPGRPRRSDATPSGTPATPKVISVSSGPPVAEQHIGIVWVGPQETSVDLTSMPGRRGLSQEESDGSYSSTNHLFPFEDLHLSQMSDHHGSFPSISVSPEPSSPRFLRPRGWSDSVSRKKHTRANSMSSIGTHPLPMVRTASGGGRRPANLKPCERTNTASSDSDYFDDLYDTPLPQRPNGATVDVAREDQRGRGEEGQRWQAFAGYVVGVAPIVLMATSIAALMWLRK